MKLFRHLSVWVLLFLGAQLFAATGARIDIRPGKIPVPLKLGTAKNGTIRYPEWLKNSARQTTFMTSNFPGDREWKQGSFSFTPEKDGIATLVLLGPWGKDAASQKWVLFDDIKVEGTKLENGGFENGTAHWFGSREVSKVAKSGNLAARVNIAHPLGQNIQLKAGQPVTVTFWFRAETPEKPQLTSAKIGDVVFQKSFSKDCAEWLPRPEPWAEIVPDGRGGNCVQISVKGKGGEGAAGVMDVRGNVGKSQSSTFLLGAGIPLTGLKGYELAVEVGVKGENIPRPPVTWEGIRMSVNYATGTIAYNDAYYNILHGSFGWKNCTWKIRIPSDVKDMSMSLGLISPAGKVCFDHVKMTVTDVPFTQKTPPVGKPYTGYQVPRLRGFNNSGTSLATPKYLDDVSHNWKGNVVKCWFHLKGNIKDIDSKLDKWMNIVEVGLPTAKQDRIYEILHIVVGWQIKELGGTQKLYTDPAYADKFIECWKKIARRFKGCKEIYAFELLNESGVRLSETPKGCPSYLELMDRTAQAINAIDPDRTIIIQTEEWWGPLAFYKMRPIKAKNIVYAIHFYNPFPVSHQGIGEWYSKDKNYKPHNAYPGTYAGVYWDKNTLRKALAPAREFQKAYNVHMIVSEFSCIRWAPNGSRARLLSDMIDLFEEYGWDWTYHGYPEFTGWMPNEGPDMWSEKILTDPPTATEVLLKKWFSKNQFPNFSK